MRSELPDDRHTACEDDRRLVSGELHEVAVAVGQSVPPEAPRSRGRPRLGVVAREVTLLPRHWEWLNAQPGGASATLRRLVEGALRSGGPTGRR